MVAGRMAAAAAVTNRIAMGRKRVAFMGKTRVDARLFFVIGCGMIV
jgi:hypothetical protein